MPAEALKQLAILQQNTRGQSECMSPAEGAIGIENDTCLIKGRVMASPASLTWTCSCNSWGGLWGPQAGKSSTGTLPHPHWSARCPSGQSQSCCWWTGFSEPKAGDTVSEGGGEGHAHESPPCSPFLVSGFLGLPAGHMRVPRHRRHGDCWHGFHDDFGAWERDTGRGLLKSALDLDPACLPPPHSETETQTGVPDGQSRTWATPGASRHR